MRARSGAEVAEREARVRVRRADARRRERLGRRATSAPNAARAGDLASRRARAMRAPTAAAGRRPGARRRPGRAGAEHRLDDLAVAGAAAQHAAERIEHLGLASGAGSRRSSASAAISMPGVQMPHCAAPCARNARLQRRDGVPSAGQPFDRRRPAAVALAERRRGRRRPARRRGSTVQAPQSPASQPTLVPVRPRSSRSTSASRASGRRQTAHVVAVDAEGRRAGRALGRHATHAPRARGARASARRRGGTRRCRARRRSASAARGRRRSTLGGRGPRGAPRRRRRASSAGRRCGDLRAGADHDARSRDRDRRASTSTHAGDHRDRDHEVAPAPELRRTSIAPRVAGRGHEDGRDELVAARRSCAGCR